MCLIITCVTSTTFSININGQLEGFFQGRRGLRQGDPLSPYLFVICMEILSRLLKQSLHNNPFHFHPKCHRIGLTRLIFADDLLLFAKGDEESVLAIAQVLRVYGEMSGLKANPSKTCLYFGGVSGQVQSQIPEKTGLGRGRCLSDI